MMTPRPFTLKQAAVIEAAGRVRRALQAELAALRTLATEVRQHRIESEPVQRALDAVEQARDALVVAEASYDAVSKAAGFGVYPPRPPSRPGESIES